MGFPVPLGIPFPCTSLVTTIATRQIRFLGHILSKEKLEELVLTGRIEGKQARGHQRLTFLGSLHRTTGVEPFELIAMLKDRREKKAVTAVYATALA